MPCLHCIAGVPATEKLGAKADVRLLLLPCRRSQQWSHDGWGRRGGCSSPRANISGCRPLAARRHQRCCRARKAPGFISTWRADSDRGFRTCPRPWCSSSPDLKPTSSTHATDVRAVRHRREAPTPRHHPDHHARFHHLCCLRHARWPGSREFRADKDGDTDGGIDGRVGCQSPAHRDGAGQHLRLRRVLVECRNWCHPRVHHRLRGCSSRDLAMSCLGKDSTRQRRRLDRLVVVLVVVQVTAAALSLGSPTG
jgi:hypothetical protein